MIGILGLLALLVVVGLFLVSLYNRLVRLRVRTQDAWASIDVQLKRRYDLIPNLVETVKGYAGHERETLEAVVEARQAGVEAGTVEEQAEAENMISGALRQLFALSEDYPDLKANENFARLQEELSVTETKIAQSRGRYNDSVREYNTAIESFPANLIAGSLGFARREFFEVELAEERQAPQVQF